jgi:hypothetical protein
MNEQELKIILEKHKAWLNYAPGGERASVKGVNFRHAYLYGFDLRFAEITNSDLQGVNFGNANLQYINLKNSDLRWANMENANLCNSCLNGANFLHANMLNVNLRESNIRLAKFDNIVKIRTQISPQTGSFIGYKIINGGIIVKLKIPEHAKRSNAPGSRKCRASEAVVVEFINSNKKIAYSAWDPTFAYEIGKTVKPKEPFSNEWYSECESGIHYYLSIEEAIEN